MAIPLALMLQIKDELKNSIKKNYGDLKNTVGGLVGSTGSMISNYNIGENADVKTGAVGGALEGAGYGFQSGGLLGGLFGGAVGALNGVMSSSMEVENNLKKEKRLLKNKLYGSLVGEDISIYAKGGRVKVGDLTFVPIQAAKEEILALPDGKMAETHSDKEHKDMKKKDVTDVVPMDTLVFSNEVMLTSKMLETVVGYRSGGYEEDEVNPKFEEIKLKDILGKDEMSFAEAADLIRKKYKVKKSDHYEIIHENTNNENLAARKVLIDYLFSLQESKKKKEKSNSNILESVASFGGGGSVFDKVFGFDPNAGVLGGGMKIADGNISAEEPPQVEAIRDENGNIIDYKVVVRGLYPPKRSLPDLGNSLNLTDPGNYKYQSNSSIDVPGVISSVLGDNQLGPFPQPAYQGAERKSLESMAPISGVIGKNTFNPNSIDVKAPADFSTPYDYLFNQYSQELDQRGVDNTANMNSAKSDYKSLFNKNRLNNLSNLLVNMTANSMQDSSVDPVLKKPYYLDQKYKGYSTYDINSATQNISTGGLETVKALNESAMSANVAPSVVSRVMGQAAKLSKSMMDANLGLESRKYDEMGNIKNFNDASVVNAGNKERDNNNQKISNNAKAVGDYLNASSGMNINETSVNRKIMSEFETNKNSLTDKAFENDVAKTRLRTNNVELVNNIQELKDEFERTKDNLTESQKRASLDFIKRMENLEKIRKQITG